MHWALGQRSVALDGHELLDAFPATQVRHLRFLKTHAHPEFLDRWRATKHPQAECSVKPGGGSFAF
jgi:hypothetical protein